MQPVLPSPPPGAGPPDPADGSADSADPIPDPASEISDPTSEVPEIPDPSLEVPDPSLGPDVPASAILDPAFGPDIPASAIPGPRAGLEDARPVCTDTMTLDQIRERRQDLISRLRVVDHWRRLVAARLDLAVAAVADIDDLHLAGPSEDQGTLPEHTELGADHLDEGLRELLGIPPHDDCLGESARLIQLRSVLRQLDALGARLRAQAAQTTHVLVERVSRDPFARPAPKSAGRAPHSTRTVTLPRSP